MSTAKSSVTTEQLRKARQYSPLALVEWFSHVESKVPKGKLWLLSEQEKYFKTALSEYFMKDTNFRYPVKIFKEGGFVPFESIVDFFSCHRLYSPVNYGVRLRDWSNLLSIGQKNNYESWEQAHG